jgi:poly(ADP-ribose) glycohydrolase
MLCLLSTQCSSFSCCLKCFSDENQRLFTDVLALDALLFRSDPKEQFEEAKLTRELRKCLSAFRISGANGTASSVESAPAIATGNWGCGAFRGDRQLKFLIQLMVASECGRDLIYFTFNDQRTSEALAYLLRCTIEHKLTVGQVYALIGEYATLAKELKGDKLANFPLSALFHAKFDT